MFWTRLIRRLKGRCVVCNSSTPYPENRKYWYCSVECACYDGTFSVRYGWLKKPSLYEGVIYDRKRSYSLR